MELSQIKTKEDMTIYLSETSGIDVKEVVTFFDVDEMFHDVTSNNGDYSFDSALQRHESYDQVEANAVTEFSYLFMDAVKCASCYPPIMASRQYQSTVVCSGVECEVVYSGSETFAIVDDKMVVVDTAHGMKINKSDVAPIYFLIKKELGVGALNLIEYFVLFSEFFGVEMKLLMECVGKKEENLIYKRLDGCTTFFKKREVPKY
jgi:hypothetical protein